MPGGIQHRLFDDTLEFADVARPMVRLQPIKSFGSEAAQIHSEFTIEPKQKIIGQFSQVFRPIAQRRDTDDHIVEPIIEVFAETTCGHKLNEILVRRG